MANRTTLHNIYLLKCTSCSLDFESLGSAKEYPKGKPLCVSCWDTAVGRICDTHVIKNCKICKKARDDYRGWRRSAHERPAETEEQTFWDANPALTDKKQKMTDREFDKKNPWTEYRERAGLATESGPDPTSLQYID